MGRGRKPNAFRAVARSDLRRTDDADEASAGLNRDEGRAIGSGRTGVAPGTDDVVLELDLERWISVNPTDRDVASSPYGARDARRYDDERFDCGVRTEVVDKKLVGGGDIDGKEFAIGLALAFEID